MRIRLWAWPSIIQIELQPPKLLTSSPPILSAAADGECGTPFVGSFRERRIKGRGTRHQPSVCRPDQPSAVTGLPESEVTLGSALSRGHLERNAGKRAVEDDDFVRERPTSRPMARSDCGDKRDHCRHCQAVQPRDATSSLDRKPCSLKP